MESHQAMLRALLCRDGVDRMRADARAAQASLVASSRWRVTALLLEGVADMLAGEADRADPVLADAVEVGTNARAWPAISTALAERCGLAIDAVTGARPRSWQDRPLPCCRSGSWTTTS
jgi:LuxR family maltose regulon positive regulatory protein